MFADENGKGAAPAKTSRRGLLGKSLLAVDRLAASSGLASRGRKEGARVNVTFITPTRPDIKRNALYRLGGHLWFTQPHHRGRSSLGSILPEGGTPRPEVYEELNSRVSCDRPAPPGPTIALPLRHDHDVPARLRHQDVHAHDPHRGIYPSARRRSSPR